MELICLSLTMRRAGRSPAPVRTRAVGHREVSISDGGACTTACIWKMETLSHGSPTPPNARISRASNTTSTCGRVVSVRFWVVSLSII